ncbi:MAG: HNH endonuclease [Alphaproteobacteria bacterium]|nr:HNH endonuclease [Alphaproteobacteria bacterium]
MIKRTILMVFTLMLSGPASAADPLAGITIEPEINTPKFDRASQYGDWIDADHDGEDTREEVLIAESLIPVTIDATGKITAGLWVGPFAGFVTNDPGVLDIDHIVPLKEAHKSGGYAWGKPRRKAYANSLDRPDHLIAVWFSTNRSKNFRDPANWMPPNRAYWCAYLDNWVAIKRKWSLSMDEAEAKAVRKGLKVCNKYVRSDKIDGRHK